MTLQKIFLCACLVSLLAGGCSDDKNSAQTTAATEKPGAASAQQDKAPTAGASGQSASTAPARAQAPQSKPAASAKNTADSAQKEETEKWNVYVALGNKAERHYKSRVEEYFDKYGTGDAPDPNKKRSKSLYVHSPQPGATLTDMIASALAMAKKKPPMDIDPLVITYCETLTALWEPLKQAETYYTNKDYVDDSYARGKELHTKILAAAKALVPAKTAFDKAIAEVDARRMMESIAKMRGDGLKIRPAVLALIQETRHMIVEITRLTMAANKPTVLDIKDYQPVYDKFFAAYKEVESTCSDAELSKKEGLERFAGSLLSSAQSVKRTASAILEAAQKGASYKQDNSRNLGNNLSSLIDSYNRLIR